VNKPLMKSILARNNDTQNSLAELLGLPQSAVSNRMNGKVDFKLSEITRIRNRYKLTAEETVDVFFTEAVS